jgi:hypothetical protein
LTERGESPENDNHVSGGHLLATLYRPKEGGRGAEVSFLQIIICEDGAGGANLEHSIADGVSGITPIPFVLQIE